MIIFRCFGSAPQELPHDLQNTFLPKMQICLSSPSSGPSLPLTSMSNHDAISSWIQSSSSSLPAMVKSSPWKRMRGPGLDDKMSLAMPTLSGSLRRQTVMRNASPTRALRDRNHTTRNSTFRTRQVLSPLHLTTVCRHLQDTLGSSAPCGRQQITASCKLRPSSSLSQLSRIKHALLLTVESTQMNLLDLYRPYL